jgi:hypothetical protein
MAYKIDRSMNVEMRRGTVDGTIKFLRPDAASPDWDVEWARERANVLHPVNYGTMGLDGVLDPAVADALPGNVTPRPGTRINAQEVVTFPA